MDILRLLDELNEMTVKEPRRFLGMTIGLNQDEVGMQIQKIRACLPQELKQAASTVKESERILDTAKDDAQSRMANANKEADKILSDAKSEAERVAERARIEQERMVSESEITKLSKAQAEEIRTVVDREAREMRGGAERYAYDVLTQLETVISKVLTTVEKGKQEVRPGSNMPAPTTRERVR